MPECENCYDVVKETTNINGVHICEDCKKLLCQATGDKDDFEDIDDDWGV